MQKESYDLDPHINARPLGVIEGYYGRPWNWSDRYSFVRFLAEYKLNTFIYAPKADAKLRHDWREPWTDSELDRLHELARTASEVGVSFGVGFSPIGVVDLSPADSLTQSKDSESLAVKLRQIASLNVQTLCLLFDDVPETGKNMATTQLKLYNRVASICLPERLIVCPSYYSSDPQLERLFGPRPEHYWTDLGRGLDSGTDFFWTGERVCSADYSVENLLFIADQFSRLPVIWDNYPVNDGAKLSRFLNLGPFLGRDALKSHSAGQLVNPMNQSFLSRLSIATILGLYEETDAVGEQPTRQDRRWEAAARRQLSGDLFADLKKNRDLFQREGLDGLSDEHRQALVGKYCRHDSPFGNEVVDWLEDRYLFDPACLTG